MVQYARMFPNSTNNVVLCEYAVKVCVCIMYGLPKYTVYMVMFLSSGHLFHVCTCGRSCGHIVWFTDRACTYCMTRVCACLFMCVCVCVCVVRDACVKWRGMCRYIIFSISDMGLTRTAS